MLATSNTTLVVEEGDRLGCPVNLQGQLAGGVGGHIPHGLGGYLDFVGLSRHNERESSVLAGVGSLLHHTHRARSEEGHLLRLSLHGKGHEQRVDKVLLHYCFVLG